MRWIVIPAALLALASCGVEGPPRPPEARQPAAASVTVTGDARMGVVGRV